MRSYMLCALVGFTLVMPCLVGQSGAAAPTPIPEEARRHFIMGETMFKEAKNSDAFTQAVSEFTEAARLAPQWPDARYNLALAKESAGDYAGAMADLKLYQQFKLSDAEARTVQDEIYAIEAKQQLKVAASSAKADADAANSKAQATAVCTNQNGTITVNLDEAHHTVTQNNGQNRGPEAAVFDTNSITFTEDHGDTKLEFRIDRVTGDFSVMQGGKTYIMYSSCQVRTAKF